MSGQERRSQAISDSLRQKRTALHWPAHGVDLVPLQAVSEPAHVRSQQGGPQEQCIKVQPYIPVITGAQVEVPPPGMS
jgi:hypothetical protein